MKPHLVLVLAVLLSRSAFAADTKEPKKVDMAKGFRSCALAEKVDVPRGGKLTEAGKESAGACLALGSVYEQGDAIDVDGRRIDANYKLALRYYESACAAGIATGCVSVGQLVETGKAMPTKGGDVLSLAAKWYALGCSLPDADDVRLSCFFAGQATFKRATGKTGKIHTRELASALRFFQRACELVGR